MDDARLKRLRWHCRRGMRELDMLLEPYCAAHAGSMPAAELAGFERFLASNDMELYAWLTRRSVPADAEFARLVERILAPHDAAP